MLSRILILVVLIWGLLMVVYLAGPLAIVAWLVAAAMWGHGEALDHDAWRWFEVAGLVLAFLLVIAQVILDMSQRFLGDAMFLYVNWALIAIFKRASWFPRARARRARRAACSSG